MVVSAACRFVYDFSNDFGKTWNNQLGKKTTIYSVVTKQRDMGKIKMEVKSSGWDNKIRMAARKMIRFTLITSGLIVIMLVTAALVPVVGRLIGTKTPPVWGTTVSVFVVAIWIGSFAVWVKNRIYKIWIEKAAQQGNATAQFKLGMIYSEGKGVRQNDDLAAKWCKKAMENGNASAKHSLAQMYYEGKGVPQSYNEAFRLFKEGAEDGHAASQCSLGLMYYEGYAGPIDEEAGRNWIVKAAEQGNASARLALFATISNEDSSPQEQ